MAGLPTKTQIQKLKATGKVADVEDEGMDEGRFFVHLAEPYSWNDGYGHQETKSFGNFREAMRAVKNIKTDGELHQLGCICKKFDPNGKYK